ncbi:dipeptidyl carboxypeptidase II [Aliidiomarina taiwanensis]|uniref:Dipeptidyl carboxypeptidase II n=1 Tax=Aliidiomarina taiwanensis TaxID=946228 RepID=A0A432X8C7_9GAMM|nr:M3 family metallopeptidase [Aliidiomarina taiwanensis]RUO43642.1 dipeptidyl carboxypeptidase II [Aliidiomarina taiwanensis]
MRLSMIAAAVGLAVTLGACTSYDNQVSEATQDAEAVVQLDMSNPFYAVSTLQYGAPDFTKISDADYAPAFAAGMSQHAAEIRAIATNPEAPTFDNTILAMEQSGKLLGRVSAVFYAMASSTSNETIRQLQGELAPKMSSHNDDIYLNKDLFARVDSIYQNRDNLGLDAESKRLVEVYHERFVRAGANLTAEQMEQIRALNKEESSLTTEFQRNVLAVASERAPVFDSVEELAGLSDATIQNAAKRAADMGMEGKYVLSLSNTTRQAALAQMTNRDARKKLWEASAYRGLGRDGGIDNRPIIARLAELRAEKAAILGYDSFGHYRLEAAMIQTPERARKMLVDMVPAVLDQVEREANRLREQIKTMGMDHELKPWDWEFYAERVREADYNLDPAEVAQYFEYNRVLQDGLFYGMGQVYGIRFERRNDLPGYHPDVEVYEVFDKDGSSMGIFYADYFARDGKRGGAWMSSFVKQSHLENTKPVVYNVMNIPKAPEGQPTLISWDNVSTMFHEMGHGVHGLFSDVYYNTLSGTAVPRDFVESPSTFHEGFALDPKILPNFAKHYETGEPIPEELLEKVLDAMSFNQGFNTLEYMAAALLDLEYHALEKGEHIADVEAFEQQALAKYGMDLSYVPPRYRSGYFSHVFSGGYASSYYAYMWSDVLASDAFAYVKADGGIGSQALKDYREHILSKGGTKEALDLYIDFRGQEPDTRHLLISRGLLDPDAE